MIPDCCLGDSRCGTLSTYVNDRCRCNACRQAKADYEREKARARGRPERVVAEHGTRSRYLRHRCRCDACRQANTDYFADYWARRAS